MPYRALLTLLGALSIAPAAVPDYFPLAVGNQWVYRVGGTRAGNPLVLAISQAEQFDGKLYYRLDGFSQGSYWLRMDDDGTLFAYDTDAKTEKVWYAFNAPERQQYQTSIPSCCGRAMVMSRTAEYEGPIGRFDTALEMAYPGVFQIGIYRELFLPYVGLVHRTENTGGPSTATYDLIYASLGGVTYISEKSLSFSLALDQTVYVANLMPPVDPSRAIPVMTARLTLRNTRDAPVALMFPSSQSFDLVIRNESGDRVLIWSADRIFASIERTEAIQGERNWAAVLPLGAGEQPLPEGHYTAEAWLTTAGRTAFTATVGFEVKYAQ